MDLTSDYVEGRMAQGTALELFCFIFKPLICYLSLRDFWQVICPFLSSADSSVKWR